MHLTLFPKTTYVSSFKKYSNFYYRNSMLIGSCVDNSINYISAINFPNISINNIDNISVNLYLSPNNSHSCNELKKSIIIYKIIEDFNIKNISWNNYSKVTPLYIDENDIFYDDKSNILSFNINSIINEITSLNKKVYGLSIVKKYSLRNDLLKYYSNNSSKPPFISIEYNECEPKDNFFINKSFCIESLCSEFFSNSIDISNIEKATYFIKNLSDSNISLYLQISPNNIDFTNDVIEAIIHPNESIAIPLATFLKYSRLKFTSNDQNYIKLNIWFQGQKLKYNLL